MLRRNDRPFRRAPGFRTLGSVCLLLAGCGGGDTTTPTVPTEPEVEVDSAQAVIDRWLDLRLAGPGNYARPAFPSHYIPSILRDVNTPVHNPVTDRGAALGRVLFYDRELSLDRNVSCASCHVQELGFTDANRRSVGFRGDSTKNHSMRLGNVVFFFVGDVFWDRRGSDLEQQALLPIMDPVEMGFDEEAGGIDALLTRMRGLEYYPILFEWAFGTPGITPDRMRLALAQFSRSLVSTGSAFDEAFEAAFRETGSLPLDDVPGLHPQARRGYRLFNDPPERGGAGCSECHIPPAFPLKAGNGTNGLPGAGNSDFKSPSLKNVAVTGPYMHDGRFATLREVVDHYADGIVDSPLLDRRFRQPDGLGLGIELSDEDREALVAFMETLTDHDFLRDPKFSDPFRR